METVVCNLCGSSQHRLVYEVPDRLFFPDECFQVVECLSCGLGFVNPRPTLREIGKYYPKEFFDYFADVDHSLRYAEEAKYLGSPDTQSLLLDVGCANGDFPRFMKARGWNVEGVEVASNATPVQDFPIYRVPFDQLEGKENNYDVVTAWAVLEHVHDPMAYFKKVGEVLKAGGRFIFLVPNYGSLASRRLYGEDVPRHLYFYSGDTVRRYAKEVGMEIIIESHNNDIYVMQPRGWLIYLITRYIKRKALQWQDIPITYNEFLRENCLNQGVVSFLRFITTHPLAFADRLGMPLIEKIELLIKRYGTVVYVAKKL